MLERMENTRRILSQDGFIGAAQHLARAFVIRIHPTHPPISRYIPEWKQIADGHWDDAISSLTGRPLDVEGYFVLGAALHARGSMGKAISVWQECMEIEAGKIRKAGLPQRRRYVGPQFTNSIGHTALLDVLAKQRILGLSSHEIVVVYDRRMVGNASYLSYWNPYFKMIDDPKSRFVRSTAFRVAEFLPTLFPHGTGWGWVHDVAASIEDQWLAQKRAPLLKLPTDDEERARLALEQVGVPRDAWFVTIHVREGQLSARRDAGIASYFKAIRRVTDAGGWVLRLGNPTMAKMPDMPQTVDFAHRERRDWLDVFLIAAPRFLIGTNSGPAWAAGTFGTPALLTNWAPIGIQSHFRNTVTLNKRLWSHAKGRDLTIGEQMTEPLAYAESEQILKREGIVAIPNSEDEIADATEGMLRMTTSAKVKASF